MQIEMIKKIKIWHLFLLAVLILIIPHLIRFFNGDILIGEESYYNARLAKEIIRNGFYDTLMQENIFFNPYHFLLALFSYFLGVEFSSKLLPFLLGILSLLLFYHILKKLFELEKVILILFFLIFSPAFIYTFVISNNSSFFIFISLAAFLIYLKSNKKYISLILFSIIPFFGLLEAFLIMLLLFSLYLYKKGNKILSILLVILAISSIYYVYLSYKNPDIEMPNFLKRDIIKDSLTELGASIGFGILSILLAFIGLISSWKYKKKIYLIYLIILILIISYFYVGSKVNIYLIFFFSIFSGIAFYRLINLKWHSKIIRNLTFLILILGLVASCIIYTIQLTKAMPNEDIIDSLRYLKNLRKSNVLSHYKNGYWIEYYGKNPIMDGNFYSITELNERFNDSNYIFLSYNLEETKKLLDNYNINYIFITPEMKNGLVWNKEEGLLFLLRNKETFKNVYKWNDVEIWEYLK